MKKRYLILFPLLLGGCAPTQGEIDLAMMGLMIKGQTDAMIIQGANTQTKQNIPMPRQKRSQGGGEPPCDEICKDGCGQDCDELCSDHPECNTGEPNMVNIDIMTPKPKESMQSSQSASGNAFMIQGSPGASINMGEKKDPIKSAMAAKLMQSAPGLKTWDQKFTNAFAPLVSPIETAIKWGVGGYVAKAAIKPYGNQYNVGDSDFQSSGHLQGSQNPVSIEEVFEE